MFPLLRCPEEEIPLSFRGPGSLTELSLPPPMTTGWRACAGRMRASRPSPSFLGDPWIRLRRIWAAAGQREPFVLRKTNPARPDGPRPPSPGAAPAGRARPVAACAGRSPVRWRLPSPRSLRPRKAWRVQHRSDPNSPPPTFARHRSITVLVICRDGRHLLTKKRG